jgi:para-aminobenzoate synthetase/4-amino-4-deoxychorismate lyase
VLAPHLIDEKDVFLYHKTTRREVYDRLRAGFGGEVDNVLLFNERGEVTETTVANIVRSMVGSTRRQRPAACWRAPVGNT